LERIVLYIDDLDRCPPQRVVDVLAAVHLMLALPLFVVVVAVDPRWLLASLRHYYRELFTETNTAGLPRADDGLAGPLDYLDKIFQIPFAVTPLSDTAASSYLTALLRPDLDTPISATPPPEDAPPLTAPVDDPNLAVTTAVATIPQPSTAAARQPSGPATSSPPQQHLPEEGPALSPPAPAPRPTTPRPHPHGEDRLAGIPRPVATGQRIVPDLRPEGLRLRAVETEFMARLGPLLPTPRAAKKLVNLYRLIRIRTRDQDLAAFIADDTYQVVQILLAILVGAPTTSRVIFTAILYANTGDLVQLLGDDHPTGVADSDWTTAGTDRRRLINTLHSIHVDSLTPVNTTLADYQQWCPKLARYSFYTRTLTTPS
jgi:hypothetical protein